MKMIYTHIIFYLFLSFIHTENSFAFQNITDIKRKLEDSALKTSDVLELVSKIFVNAYPECHKDLENIKPKTVNVSLSKYPFIIDNIGKGLNDLGDEIECLNAFSKTQYVIAIMDIENLINHSEKRLKEFLNLTTFSLGACITENCKDPLKEFIRTFLNFQNATERALFEGESKVEDYHIILMKIIMWICLIYIIIKLVCGTYRLLFYPKGYNTETLTILNKKIDNKENKENKEIIEKNENMIINDNIDKDKSEYLILDEEKKEYDPEYDYTTVFPLKLRIVRFFDCFNDVMLFSKKTNRYFNDKGLETIVLLRAIVLYFIIFYNTFTSLFQLPSKDILNKSFFTSKMIFVYRLSTHSLSCWIFLEAAYTGFKLMKFIKNQMAEYENKKSKYSNYIRLLFINLKFLCLFIPKIIMFLFCYYFFYQNILKFRDYFAAKTTFTYVHDKVITNQIQCNTNSSLIFHPLLFTFMRDTSNFNQCYDFTFVYTNILFSVIVFMILLYLMLIFQNKIFEILIFLINLSLFFGLMKVVKDDVIESTKDKLYIYYHFRGQEYTNKIAYLSLGVYHLGFIIGLLCFNFDNIKEENKYINKDKKNDSIIDNENDMLIGDLDNSNNSDNSSGGSMTRKFRNRTNSQFSFEMYYPLSFLDCFLNGLKNMSSHLKAFIIIIIMALMILLSFGYKIVAGKNELSEVDELNLEFNQLFEYYFLFERHIFLILFFFMTLFLITFEKKGFLKKILRFKLNTAISRTGFTITCLYNIFGYFSFCAFILKIKFNLPTFFIISIGNFLIIFIVCFFLNCMIELPARKFIKTMIRYKKEMERKQRLSKKYNLNKK